jgi:hypothetical protein
MIVLCANCHGRKGNGRGQIDRTSLRRYKRNLAIINARYGEYERRVLDFFAEARPAWRDMSAKVDMGIAVMNRLADYGEQQGIQTTTLRAASSELGDAIARFRVNLPDNIEIARGLQLLVANLIEDGYLRWAEDHPQALKIDGRRVLDIYELTESGRDFVDRWKSGQSL